MLLAIGTCSYGLAKFFCPSSQGIYDSRIQYQRLILLLQRNEQDSDLYMASFDIRSLFTNIPLNETISVCEENVFKNKSKITGLLKRDLEKL